ncbi:MAG: DUF4349 domain-containing protein [Bacteroidetes bacterium]|nr:DUF4349 domain-containing protein [Bacteroidota bacterium]
MKKLIIFGLLAIGALSCAQKSKETAYADTLSTENPDQSAIPDLYSSNQGEIIKTAECRFQVVNLNKCKESIESSVKKHLAYISSSSRRFENPMLEESLTIRVPNLNFGDLLNEIKSQAKFINYEKINTEDVAKEFVDLESRLQTKREVEKRYAEILRTKAGTIEELLKAEQQIGKLHEDIEATVSRINYLRDEVRYSTIKLEIYEVTEQQLAEIPDGPGPLKKFGVALASGWSSTIDVLVALTYLWPLAILGIVGYWLFLRNRKSLTKETAR